MRHPVIAATLLVACALADARIVGAQSPPTNPGPAVAVLDFTNASLVDHDEYDPFRVGLAGMLITDLARNPELQIVERERLRAVLDELALAVSGDVNPAAAARAGRILGAQYVISGVFVIDRRGTLRIDARAVSVETSQVVHVESVTDDADDLLRAVSRLGRQLGEGLDLPGAAPPADGGEPGAVPGQAQINLKYARAMLEEDRGDFARALALYEEFLSELPVAYAPNLRRAVEDRVRELRNPPRM